MERDFNSRPHGGRHSDLSTLCLSCHFNSRPHGGRPALSFSSSQVTFISTHALTEGDATGRGPFRLFQVFQLTPSRRATIRPPFLQLHCVISTHALTEGDKCAHHHQSSDTISTHALTEGDERNLPTQILQIISTHALTEGDEALVRVSLVTITISTHALTEGDINITSIPHTGLNFNSRPHGGRPDHVPQTA